MEFFKETFKTEMSENVGFFENFNFQNKKFEK